MTTTIESRPHQIPSQKPITAFEKPSKEALRRLQQVLSNPDNTTTDISRKREYESCY